MMSGFRDAWLTLPGNARGAMWVVVGTFFFALNDTFVKQAGLTIHPFQIGLTRYVLGIVLLLPVFILMGREGLATKRLGLHFLRALIAGSGQILVFYSLILLILADATVISFSRPLFMTALAVILLHEAVGWRRWAATTVGFIGVLVVVRPGDGPIDAGWLVGLTAAFLFSIGLILIRRLASTEPPNRILFYYHLFGSLLSLGPAIWMWKTPTPEEWLVLAMVGVMTTIAMFCFVRGFAIGEASILGPMEYTRLVYATALGYVFFAEVPGPWTWVGSVIIIGSAFYIARNEAFRLRGGAGS
jgi:drug/metabolite transporter (DMT)-like permease